jgi:hypothetical protein
MNNKTIKKMPFLKNEEQEGKTGPVWGLGPGGGYKERVKEGECDGNIMYSCMEENGKMRPVETISEMGGRRDKGE